MGIVDKAGLLPRGIYMGSKQYVQGFQIQYKISELALHAYGNLFQLLNRQFEQQIFLSSQLATHIFRSCCVLDARNEVVKVGYKFGSTCEKHSGRSR